MNPGTFLFESFTASGLHYVRWGYRSTFGRFFSGVSRDLLEARSAAELQSGERLFGRVR